MYNELLPCEETAAITYQIADINTRQKEAPNMSRKYRLATALDIDDLLMECTSYAIRLANEKYKFDPPMTIYEKSTWGRLNSRIDTIYEYFDDPEFYRTQPAYKGAREFVQKLSQMTDVYIATAVPPEFSMVSVLSLKKTKSPAWRSVFATS